MPVCAVIGHRPGRRGRLSGASGRTGRRRHAERRRLHHRAGAAEGCSGELVVAAAKASVSSSSDAEDITSSRRKSSASKVDYGGYTAPLAFLGRHAAEAMLPSRSSWHWPSGAKGFEIDGEPFWQGLAAGGEPAAASASVPEAPIIISTPAVLRSRLQRLRVLNMAKVRHMGAVIGLTEEEGGGRSCRTGDRLTSEEQKDKSTYPAWARTPSTKSSLSPRRERRKRRWPWALTEKSTA